MLVNCHDRHQTSIVDEITKMTELVNQFEPIASPIRKREVHFKVTRRIAYGQLMTNQLKFSKYYAIDEARFLKTVDTGDVMLFRSRDNNVAWIQRTFLSSEFDHVGILMRFGPCLHDLYLLEAVGEGIRMVPWENARWYCGTYFEMIGYRKLNM